MCKIKPKKKTWQLSINTLCFDSEKFFPTSETKQFHVNTTLVSMSQVIEIDRTALKGFRALIPQGER